jgi:putative ABC transport system permease protein
MVGVGAVVVMVAVAAGTRNQVIEQVTALGSDTITIRSRKAAPSGARASTVKEKASLTAADAAALARLEGVAHAVPGINKSLRVTSQGAAADTTVIAALPEVFAVEGQSACEGRLFTEREEKSSRRVAVVGPTLRRNLTGEASLVGRNVEVKKQPFLVVGELAAKGLDASGQDLDDRLYLPLRSAITRIMAAQRHVEFILVQAEPGVPLDLLAEDMRRLLRQRHHLNDPADKDDFVIHTQLEALAAQEESSRVFGALTVGVATISLLVAGVGIMAVQLIGVRERTPEIGVRRAVGARRGDVLVQFLLEAVILGLGGGAAGALAGLGLAWVIRLTGVMSFDLPWTQALSALAVSLSVAVVFGLWPARQAARLTPVEAVRHA